MVQFLLSKAEAEPNRSLTDQSGAAYFKSSIVNKTWAGDSKRHELLVINANKLLQIYRKIWFGLFIVSTGLFRKYTSTVSTLLS